MKFSRLIFVLLIFSTIPCLGQQKIYMGAKSNHSFHVSVGATNYNTQAGYTYEWAFHRNWTVLSNISLKGELLRGDSFLGSQSSSFLLLPTISVEPRLYYNLNKRNSTGKSTLLNSGGYVGITASCFFPSIYGSNDSKRDFIHGGVSPHWGWRRVFRNNLFVDFHAGALILFSDKETAWGPDLNLKFGYLF